MDMNIHYIHDIEGGSATKGGSGGKHLTLFLALFGPFVSLIGKPKYTFKGIKDASKQVQIALWSVFSRFKSPTAPISTRNPP
jgi:hypothetical protein